MDRILLKFLTIIGFALLPVLIRKPPIKDWFLVFFIKGMLTGILDNIVVTKNKVSYPVRHYPKHFKIHLLFDFLLFPIACVFYNQLTYRSSIPGIIFKVFYLSVPMAIIEYFAEKYTNLLKFKNNWNSLYSLISLTCTFWFVRASIALIRYIDKKQNHQAISE
ncbi:CBO0543 family protein [Bacillus sp. PS06]|uniref:CBO0543 family protein n=1 Tax=Bacillus sp. PS06 TaxID=2764176 RepID=UPI00178722D4|nr:CBO0543 family protein [Bacillus sp. PS06]MBD8067378.1 hypothetical protein [Bacillus sp. PS06]